jgi:hypothetical protein
VVRQTRGNVALTDLGRRIADPQMRRAAQVAAFLHVPLFAKVYENHRGSKLPADRGLENELVQLGVAPKQAVKARQAMQRSAKFAGFFDHGSDRLVEPGVGSLPDEPDEAPESNLGGSGGGAGGRVDDRHDHDGPQIMRHPLIQGLLAALPDPGSPFPAEDRETWLKTLDMNLSVIYGRAKPSSADTRPRNFEQEYS